MGGRTATEELELIDVGSPGGPGPGEPGPDGGPGGGAAPALPQRIYVTGIILALAAILMFFMGLTSSFIVRRGLSNDWVPFELPRVLWLNTAVLLLSSFTIERARRALAQGLVDDFRRWWRVTTALGLGFLVGQLIAWRELARAGVYLATNPSSSFFYVLTAAHGAHLLGGVLALVYVGFRGARSASRMLPGTAVTVTSIYWHFMDGLWVFLFLLLLLG